jgi:hypothetical protein
MGNALHELFFTILGIQSSFSNVTSNVNLFFRFVHFTVIHNVPWALLNIKLNTYHKYFDFEGEYLVQGVV